MQDLERRLLEAEVVRTEFHITAEGAVSADVQGYLRIRGEQVILSAMGEFMSEPLQVDLMTLGDDLHGGVNLDNTFGPRPQALREGMLLGLTRMGLLHNIAVLSGNNPPEGTDGKVRDWVQAVDAGYGPEGSLHFGIVVAGTPSGAFDLHLQNGWPALREQTVQFPEGEMRVVERYTRFGAR